MSPAAKASARVRPGASSVCPHLVAAAQQGRFRSAPRPRRCCRRRPCVFQEPGCCRRRGGSEAAPWVSGFRAVLRRTCRRRAVRPALRTAGRCSMCFARWRSTLASPSRHPPAIARMPARLGAAPRQTGTRRDAQSWIGRSSSMSSSRRRNSRVRSKSAVAVAAAARLAYAPAMPAAHRGESCSSTTAPSTSSSPRLRRTAR